MADLTPQDDPEGCFVAPDNLSPKHQDLLRLSPLLREHCSGKLLTREEEQQLFQQLSEKNRDILALQIQLPDVRNSALDLFNTKMDTSRSSERPGTQLRTLCSNPILESPLSTDQYTQQIEQQMTQHLQTINQCDDQVEQIRLLSDIVLHPSLREEIHTRYLDSYRKTGKQPGTTERNHRRILRLKNEVETLKGVLVKHNLRLVIKHAALYAKHHIDIQDLIQEGTVGLLRACDLYDHRRGYKFSTYASRWILQTILNLLNEITFTIQIPRNMSQLYRTVNQYIDEEVKRGGRAPSPLKIADALDLEEEDVITALRATWVASSLNSPINDDPQSGEMIDFVEEEEDAYEKVDLFLQYRMIKQLIEKIPSERDRDILKRRYAIGYGESTLEDIANLYGLTKERIRQIINQHLKAMRQEVMGEQD